MTPSGMVGRILKRLVLRPRIRGKSWEQLCKGAEASRDNFLAMLSQETDATASVEGPGDMSMVDTLAHLAAANDSIALRLSALRDGRALPAQTPALFPGHGAWNLEESKANYLASWQRLAETASPEILSGATQDHDFFGPMTAREWIVLISYHHEYHMRRLSRVKALPAYREAQGAKW